MARRMDERKMTAGELAVVLAAVLCCIGFAALIVVLVRVLDTLRSLRGEVDVVARRDRPAARRAAGVDRRRQGRRWPRPATTSSDSTGCSVRPRRSAARWRAVAGSPGPRSSTPVIKTAALATGTSRAVRRLRRKERRSA